MRRAGLLGLTALAVSAAAPTAAPGMSAHRTEAATPVATSELLAPWGGPHGLPRMSGISAAELEAAYAQAIAEKRREVQAIVANPAAPTFENTILSLDRSGAALERIHAVYTVYASTKADDAIRAVAGRIAPMRQSLDDEIAQNAALFARVDAVSRSLPKWSGPDARRLTELTRAGLVRRGAMLDAAGKARLAQLNGELAGLQQRFAQNLAKDEARLFVVVRDEARLKGLPDAEKKAARAAAAERGMVETWVIRNTRPAVWAVAKHADDRRLREEVWQMWMGRGSHRGETDNAPITTAILRLRGEKAKLFGRSNFAEHAFDGRMVEGPRKALDLLMDVWAPVSASARQRLADMQAIADAEGVPIRLQPWDHLYYSEKLRQRRFGFDSKSVESYFQASKLLEGMMWAAGRTYGLAFEKIGGADVVSPDIEVFQVKRNGRLVGYLYVDLFRRDGKQRGSWASQYRVGRAGSVLPVVALHSNAEPSIDGRPATIDYEIANVLFHEFGHVLHTLSTTSPYAGTGSLAVPWDFVEVPSLLNERWLLDEAVLSRFALHRDTGQPMPAELAEKLRQVVNFDRVFSVNLEYLSTAIVDLRLHLLADGRDVDVAAAEAEILSEIGMPGAIDPTMRALHSYHAFSPDYAAGVYTYLWSDMLAADIAEAFVSSPGGLYDPRIAKFYFDTILSRGARVPIEEAFREFRGRDPDPGALMRRFGLGHQR